MMLIPYIALLSISFCYCSSQPNAGGFTTDLIHRDSPLSPLYDPSLTLEQRIDNARNRSIAQSGHFTGILGGTAVSPVSPDAGSYLIQFFMGTPLKQSMAMIDTGSSVIWTQCSPCVRCRPQKFQLFDPKSSFSYKAALCGSPACASMGNKGFCDANRDKCQYLISYGDGSHSTGPVGSETFTFRSTLGGLLRFPNVVFGCGTDNYDKFPSDTPVGGANIIIDSGTALTLLPVNFYDDVETAIANSIEQRAVRDHGAWRLCYTEAFVMPEMTVHFTGADVEWKQENVFVRVDQDYECLALQPRQTIPIYGSVAQVNYMVGYDVTRNTVSFKPTECGR